MPVWQSGLKVVKLVYELTTSLPKSEDYALRGQLRDAAMSITGNIAEAFGREHTKDKLNFYYFSRGSAYEVESHLICGLEVTCFSKEQTESIRVLLHEITGELNKIIKTLKSRLTGSQSHS